MKYAVLKQHFGDRQYMEGDIREVADKQVAEELLKMGLIAEIKTATKPAADTKAKAAPAHKNKMADDPNNKIE